MLYSQAIGRNQTPADIATALATEVETRGVAFHREAAGSRPPIRAERPDSNCNSVRARVG